MSFPTQTVGEPGLLDDALGLGQLELGGSFSAAGTQDLLAALPRSVTLTMTRTRLNTGERALLTADAARLGHSLRFS
ncbi:MAG: hypothetical protein RBU37_16925 [Myxococcota bacterium]|nr:hypothetical protein [Myxococcota bacterium]